MVNVVPSIPEFYRNKTIFITGGSGFLGQVLIEKLLRSCPDLNEIYMLMRPKKGRTIEERIKVITDLPLFDVVKEQRPGSLNKIKCINGDVKELGLGMSPEDRKQLVKQVNVVIHAAASVRFDDSLTDAILMNTRGTREIVMLVLEMKKLDVFVHTSTTYCHSDKKVVEERMYPPLADWRKTIEIAENVDRHTLNVLTAKYMHPLPNTYTFSKSLSEHVVNDLCDGKIPTIIYRPSIISSSIREPFPGWIYNLNGPSGIAASHGKGLQSTLYGDPEVAGDYVSVDLTAKAMLMASWKQATIKDKGVRLTLSVYNGSNSKMCLIKMKMLMREGNKNIERVPYDNILWYPHFSMTKNFYIYFFKLIFFHILPFMILDEVLKLFGKKPFLMKIQRRIYVANMVLSYFMVNEWTFKNDKCWNLQKELLPCDFDDFYYKVDEVDAKECIRIALRGIRKYFFKEGDDLEKARKHLRRMWIVSRIFNILFYAALVWLVFFKINILLWFVDKWNQIFVNLRMLQENC